MNPKEKLFQEIAVFAEKLFSKKNYFLCVYGSYASGHNTEDSDMDMFIATEYYTTKDFGQIRDFLIDFHIRHHLNLDDEVPYENKLMISYDDIIQAIELKPFIIAGTQYIVPVVNKSKEFLSSREVRWRLILNALTSPHLCISGNTDIYMKFKSRAEKSIIRLAHGLTNTSTPTADELFKALVFGVNGEEGEMYLGYKNDKDEVIKYLKKLILRNY